MKIWSSKTSEGFALPTVIITSVVMMIVLLVGLSSLSSISSTLDTQRQGQLAREAARAGIKLAQHCIDLGMVDWDDASPLRPGRGCSGYPTQSTTANFYLVYDTTLNQRTTFTVGTPVSLGTGGYLIQANGIYETKRSSSATATTKSVSANVSIKYTIDLSTSAAVSASGHGQVCALLKVVGSTKNEAHCWGQNEDGRAGIGTKNSGDSYCTNTHDPSITYIAERKINGDGTPLNSCKATYRKVKDDTPTADNDITLEDGVAHATRTRAFRDHEIAITSGQGFACTISTDAAAAITSNRVYCWGDDYQGRLGQGQKVKPGVSNSPGCPVSPNDSTTAQCHTPVAVRFSQWENDGYYPVDVAAGIDFACILAKQNYTDSTGRVYCWGHNNKGQLGRGSASTGVTYSATPAPVINYTDNAGSMLSARGLFVGVGRTVCATSGVYVARCWGENNYGQVGNNQQGTHAYYPQSVIDQSNNQLFASKLAHSGTVFGESGDSGHTCAITKDMPSVSDGSLYCWGKNEFGELGAGFVGVSNSARARQVDRIYDNAAGTAWTADLEALDIAAAHMASCATIKSTTAGTTKVYCWGRGMLLGVGALPPEPVSCPTPGPDPYNTYLNLQCSVDDDGVYNGQTVRAKPAPIKWTGDLPTSVVGGAQRFCMIVDIHNYCWGANNTGQIGDGTTNYRFVPTLSKFLSVTGSTVYY